MDAAAEIGRNPVSTIDLAWVLWRMIRRRGTGRLNPARETKFSGAYYGDKGILLFPLVQLTTSRVRNLIAQLIHALLCVMTMHTYIHNTYRWY